jgi:hypothetical protein
MPRRDKVGLSIKNWNVREHRAGHYGAGKPMRAAIRIGLMFLAVTLAAPHSAAAETAVDRFEAALVKAQSLIQARTNDVRELRKQTDDFVKQLDELAENKSKVTPELKFELARKRLYYYSRLNTFNTAVKQVEQVLTDPRLPTDAAPAARQKVLDLLARFRDEIRFTVVSLNHVARSLKDL